MATVKRQNVCFGQEYADAHGQQKIAWKKIGTAFHSDQGTISIKLDSVPCGVWNGWINLFDEREQANNQGYSQSTQQPPPQNQTHSHGDHQPRVHTQPQAQPQGFQPQAQQIQGIQPNQDFAPAPPLGDTDDLPF